MVDEETARQEPTRAVRYFEQALDRQPYGTTTARKLAGVCGRSGKGGYGNLVRPRSGLKQADQRIGSHG